MVFLTVGTHEQQFNRLIRYVDDLKVNNIITEEVIIQTGYSTYEPKECQSKPLFPYEQMVNLIDRARIVITHGGPSSFIMALQIGKVPIVVPRLKLFGEHVNDHQLSFCREVSERQGNILLIEDIDQLADAVTNYDDKVSEMPIKLKSNNIDFCNTLEDFVLKMEMRNK